MGSFWVLSDSHRLPSRLIRTRCSDGALLSALQPANIFLCKNGVVPHFTKVLDFGIAKRVHHTGGLVSSHLVLMGTDQAFSLFRRDRLSGSARYLIQDRQCWDEACDIDYELCDMSG